MKINSVKDVHLELAEKLQMEEFSVRNADSSGSKRSAGTCQFCQELWHKPGRQMASIACLASCQPMQLLAYPAPELPSSPSSLFPKSLYIQDCVSQWQLPLVPKSWSCPALKPFIWTAWPAISLPAMGLQCSNHSETSCLTRICSFQCPNSNCLCIIKHASQGETCLPGDLQLSSLKWLQLPRSQSAVPFLLGFMSIVMLMQIPTSCNISFWCYRHS